MPRRHAHVPCRPISLANTAGPTSDSANSGRCAPAYLSAGLYAVSSGAIVNSPLTFGSRAALNAEYLRLVR
jgi:hypothetical protein